MRTFVGIPLPSSFHPWMQTLEAAAKRVDLPVRTVPAETCHITLCFLGDIQARHVDALTGPLTSAVAGSHVLNVRLDTLGVFKHGDRQSVLWAGSSQESREASDLAAAVDEACSRIVRRTREPFLLHVTVARFHRLAPTVDAHAISQSFPGPYAFLATQVVLFESRLGLGAPVYCPLLSLPLPAVAE